MLASHSSSPTITRHPFSSYSSRPSFPSISQISPPPPTPSFFGRLSKYTRGGARRAPTRCGAESLAWLEYAPKVNPDERIIDRWLLNRPLCSVHACYAQRDALPSCGARATVARHPPRPPPNIRGDPPSETASFVREIIVLGISAWIQSSRLFPELEVIDEEGKHRLERRESGTEAERKGERRRRC